MVIFTTSPQQEMAIITLTKRQNTSLAKSLLFSEIVKMCEQLRGNTNIWQKCISIFFHTFRSAICYIFMKIFPEMFLPKHHGVWPADLNSFVFFLHP